MKLILLLTLTTVLALTTTAAYGQFGGFGAPPPPAPAWSTFHLDPKVRIKLDFRNASVDGVLNVLSNASGIPIIKDPSLTGGLTVQSPKPMSLPDAFALVNATLNLKKFEFTKQGNFLEVTPMGAAPAPGAFPGFGRRGGMGGRFGRRGGVGGPGGPGAPGGPGGPGGASTNLQVYSIKYANATDLANTINTVFAPSGGQNQPGNGGGPFGGPGGPGGGGRFGAPGGAPAAPSNLPTVKASADDYSNSLIVYAEPEQQRQIADIIKQIDQPSAEPQQARVFHLQYAKANEIYETIQDTLNAITPLGRGTTQRTNNQNNGRFFVFFGPPPSDNTGGTVVADERTNSLIVTAIPSNLDEVSKVVQELDQPAQYQSTTFVYEMKYARADVVANLLNESFGNRSTNGPVGGSLTGTNPQQTAINVNASNANNTNSQPGGLNNGSNGNNGNGNGNRNNTTNGQQSNGSSLQFSEATSLDAEGHVVNVRSLWNRVLLVPNIDRNSIIVVAAPEDQPLVKSILEEMDQMPEQVMIETLVVEVNLEKKDQFGVEWSFLYNKPFGINGATQSGSQSFGLAANTTQPQGLHYTLTAPQFQAFLQAITTHTKFNVRSVPSIFVSNNATSQINISQSLPYVTNQSVSNGTVFNSFAFLDVGIVLTVTPRVTADGYVTMDVSQTADDFVGYTSFNAPITNERQAQTTVSVKDGATVVLGGIINNQVNTTVNKIPILGDIPLFGQLFRSTSRDNQKTELLVFLTPHVVRDPADAARLRATAEADLGGTVQQMVPKAAAPGGVSTDTPSSPAATPGAPSEQPSQAPPETTAVPAAAPATAPLMTPTAGTGQVRSLPPPQAPAETATTK